MVVCEHDQLALLVEDVAFDGDKVSVTQFQIRAAQGAGVREGVR